MKVLFFPVSFIGPINASIGIAEVLFKRGHEIIFAVDFSRKGTLIKYGFKEITYSANSCREINYKEFSKEFIRNHIPYIQKPTIESYPKFLENLRSVLQNFKFCEPQIKNIIDEVKPDVIINANLPVPSILTSNIPWVYLHSGDPLFLPDDDHLLPPAGSGYSMHDNSKWSEFRAMSKRMHSIVFGEFLKWFESYGVSPKGIGLLSFQSEYLNIYLYPEELDYTDVRPLGSNYLRVDSMVREDPEIFEVPEKLKNSTGKLIYFSMGTLGSVDVVLMKRLIGILAKSTNRFIVSKGMLHDEFDLPDNMWGKESLPQTKILPIVDLFITHGGNNSTTEAMYFGKPMIVLPIFGDQPDNAMRIKEKGFGIMFFPYSVSENELLDAIEKLLADENLKIKLENASKRIRNSKSRDVAAQYIEALVTK